FRGDLVRQFLVESIVYSAISFVLGLFLAWVFLPSFNSLADKSLVLPWMEWWLIPIVVSGILLTGFLAGVYPALYLSAFKPISVLKGSLSRGSKSSIIRSTMVTFQFATSIVLIICTFVTYQQMAYILNKEIGFDKERVLMIQGANTLGEKQKGFKEELLRLSQVKHATISEALPVEGTHRNGNSFWKDGRSKLDEGVGAQIWRVDPDYMQTLGMKLIEGRGFIEDLASDSAAIIINQTMAKKLGLESPVGERIMNWQTWTVIGVVEDFHFESMKGDIESLCFARGDFGSIISAKIETPDMISTIASISDIWGEFMPNQPIRYTFLDKKYALMYSDVQRTSNVILVFAILAVIVACLGLFALSTFMLEQRRKEISIRKVLGASLRSILNLITINFLKPVLIAFVMAVPIGWYMMNRWLEDYTYRIEISWATFAIAGGTALLIALLTISAESLKAALADPAENLRSE
ncbi:MAG: FtsX-like permease family protein, partial [Bacteroidota bacterium]